MGFLLGQSDLRDEQALDCSWRHRGAIMPSEVDGWTTIRFQLAMRSASRDDPIAERLSQKNAEQLRCLERREVGHTVGSLQSGQAFSRKHAGLATHMHRLLIDFRDPDTIAAMLAVASKQDQPFVVFTNADSGKDESFQPQKVVSFVAE